MGERAQRRNRESDKGYLDGVGWESEGVFKVVVLLLYVVIDLIHYYYEI